LIEYYWNLQKNNLRRLEFVSPEIKGSAMRDFIKSTLRFSWAMSLFGVQQLENMVEDSSQQNNKTATAFDSITHATEEQLGGAIKDAFKAGDQLQSGMVDMMFGASPRGRGQSQPPPASSTTPVGSQPGPQPPASSVHPTETYPVHSGRLNTATFIALGEGLAAGMGDFTLSDVTQIESFPAQMARQMRTQFPQPLIQPPGICSAVGFAELPVIVPRPMQTTVLDQLPPQPVNNLSVPGYRLSDALNLRPSQPLIQRNDAKQTAANLILGVIPIAYGEDGSLPTQLECAVKRQPTFTLVELGYYEALEAAVKGDPALLPDASSFHLNYSRALRSLRSSGSEVLMLNIPDPFDTAHFSTITLAAKVLKLEPDILLSSYDLKPDDLITANGLNEIGFQLFGKRIDVLPDGCVLGAEVAGEISRRINELNAVLTSLAQEQGALVYDLHGFFRRVRNESITIGSRRLTAEYLGGFYSLNGYYPGATGHALIANELLHQLNIAYGSDFRQIDLQTVMQNDPVADYRQAEGPDWTANQLPQPQRQRAAPESRGFTATGTAAVASALSGQTITGWEALEQPQGISSGRLRLPPGLEQVLPLSTAASYFGDGIAPMNCCDPQGIQWGSCGQLLFGGLAMVDSHLSGQLRLRFTPPENNLTHFEVSFLDGFVGDDAMLVTPQFFKMAFQQSRVDAVPGTVSSGTLNLATGEVSDLTVYAGYSSTALSALVGINPTFPRQPLSFPGQYGTSWAQFEQRSDGLLDFTFYGSTFVPLGRDIRWPLNFFSATQQFATIPAQGTVMHPHLSLSTKEPESATGQGSVPDIPYNTIQELTLFTHNSSFGDRFGLDIEEWGGEATGRSQVLGRVQLQFGEQCGNSVPVAVYHLNPGGFLAPFAPTPVSQFFPVPLPPGPMGFNEFLRFPLRTYSLNDLAILDDPFDISVGAVNLTTGLLLQPLLHRAFINQDLIFALIRVAPESAKTFFLFRGPAKIERGVNGQLIFRFKGSIRIPFPEGMLFPQPDLATGYTTLGKEGFLDPYLWIHAIHDGDGTQVVKQGGASNVLASTGDRFSYSYMIPGDPEQQQASFEYENHSQAGKYRMHSLAWVGFSNSGTSGAESGEYDTITFTCFGVWSKDGVNSLQQATVQVSTSPEKPYVGIQIGGGAVSNVNTKPPDPKDAEP
jgi:hypothetical protein